MSQDGKEAAAALIEVRLKEFLAFLSNKQNKFTPGYETQAQQLWDDVKEAYQYWQQGSVP